MKWLIGLALACVATQALAAPFCVVASYGRQCFYYDYPSCQRAAANVGGACVVAEEPQPAPARSQAPSSGAPFCVVHSFGTQCYYYNADACRDAAQSSGGACVVNPNR